VEIRQLHRSKALEWAGYAAETRTLRLRFRHGGVYDYADVPSEVFDGLATSAHPWTEWQQHIKATYHCDRVDEG
jgi:hypothetical protein